LSLFCPVNRNGKKQKWQKNADAKPKKANLGRHSDVVTQIPTLTFDIS